MTPPVWSAALGLVLAVVLIAVLAGMHRAYAAVVRRRVVRSLALPLAGRTRDVAPCVDRRAS